VQATGGGVIIAAELPDITTLGALISHMEVGQVGGEGAAAFSPILSWTGATDAVAAARDAAWGPRTGGKSKHEITWKKIGRYHAMYCMAKLAVNYDSGKLMQAATGSELTSAASGAFDTKSTQRSKAIELLGANFVIPESALQAFALNKDGGYVAAAREIRAHCRAV
jgi:hypothetical protein